MQYEMPAFFAPVPAWDCDPLLTLPDETDPLDFDESDEWIEHSMDRWGDRLVIKDVWSW